MNIHDMRKKRLETMRAHPGRFTAEDKAWLEEKLSNEADVAQSGSPSPTAQRSARPKKKG